MNKKAFAAILALVLALALLAGCGQAAPATPTPVPDSGDTPAVDTPAPAQSGRAASNEIVIGIAQDLDSLDPHHMTAAGTQEHPADRAHGCVFFRRRQHKIQA